MSPRSPADLLARLVGQADSPAEAGQNTLRICQQIVRIDYEGRATLELAGAVEDPLELRNADESCALLDVVFEAAELRHRRDDLRGIADQEAVPDLAHPVEIHHFQHVNRHVLLIPEGSAIRDGAEQRVDHPAPVRLVCSHRLRIARVLRALRRLQPVGVEGLVVYCTAECFEHAHGHGGACPGGRPHGDTKRVAFFRG